MGCGPAGLGMGGVGPLFSVLAQNYISAELGYLLWGLPGSSQDYCSPLPALHSCPKSGHGALSLRTTAQGGKPRWHRDTHIHTHTHIPSLTCHMCAHRHMTDIDTSQIYIPHFPTQPSQIVPPPTSQLHPQHIYLPLITGLHIPWDKLTHMHTDCNTPTHTPAITHTHTHAHFCCAHACTANMGGNSACQLL